MFFVTRPVSDTASLCIYYKGKCVVDLYGGWKDLQRKEPYTSDTLQLVFSVSKGILSAAIALCVERGDLLSHRADLPYINQTLTVDDVCDWSKMISLLINEKPHWKPGTTHGYHGHTIGYIAGELIHRVDPQHRSYGQFVRDELDHDYYVGITNNEIDARVAPLFEKQVDRKTVDPKFIDSAADKTLTFNGALPLEQSQMIYNESKIHRAELPAVNGITNARSLAKIYSLLIGDVHENGNILKCLLSKKTLSEAIKNSTPIGELDQTLYKMPTTFSKGGFQIYGDSFHIFGDGVFGHTGYGGSCAFAYPSQQLTYAHVCNHLDPYAFTIDHRSIRIIQAIENILKHQ
ncbi:unnamed protein product [Rotaria sp. Silwood2]|nr:unnamed protein product [Rotaria sp. Silwood2]CAF4491016.1 unnamed protein product [Rotaria sp. Silwood2]